MDRKSWREICSLVRRRGLRTERCFDGSELTRRFSQRGRRIVPGKGEGRLDVLSESAAPAAEGVEVERWRGRSEDGEIVAAEGVFESGGAGGEGGVGVEAIERVVFGLGERDEAEAAGAIEVEELGQHFCVERADVHEEDVGDVAVVESARELAVIDDVGVGG